MVRAHGAEYAFSLERAQELERERGWIVGLELIMYADILLTMV